MNALFISFPASDYAASKKYYEQVIGLEAVVEFEGAPHRFTNYDLGGMVLKLYEWKKEYYGCGHSGLFIETDDIDEIVERVRASGGAAGEITVLEWGGRCCSLTDPFGNIFDLIDARQKGSA